MARPGSTGRRLAGPLIEVNPTRRQWSRRLYLTLQSIRHGDEEDAAPIRFEHLSDFQLEALIKRLERG
jgi:hypothetical protein